MANESAVAYDFSRFERQDYSGAAAPARRPYGTPATPKAPRVVRKKPIKTREEQIADSKDSALRALKVFLGAVAFLLMFSSLLHNKVVLVEMKNQNIEIQKRLESLQQENIGLENRLNEMIASYDVDEYARAKLGMVKLNEGQVVYFEYDDADQVIMYNQKS